MMKKIITNSFRTSFLILAGASCLIYAGSTSCGSAKAADQDTSKYVFRYREVFLPEGIGNSGDLLGLNSLDDDWGLWGHNLAKVVPDDPSQNIYAKQNGTTMKKQFCFSSNHLYEYIEQYISKNFGESELVRFAILPNDNDIVCLCEKCIVAGNTKGDASPAVFNLINRLSKRFPSHYFYTSDYRTTQSLPTDTMPSNSGVLVSAMNYPLSTVETPEEIQFINRLGDWKNKTDNILVWDYINNFDDYFTPYPTFNVMQRRLKNYRDNKVTSVFLNGSGTDISALSRLRTEVLAALTADPDIDWKPILIEKANEYYPVTGQTIADFMLAQEDAVTDKGVTLPLYEGMSVERRTYLPEDLFIEFHDKLLNQRKGLTGKEREEIDILLGELALTRMELNRINGTPLLSEPFKRDLEALTEKGYPSYNESGWSIDTYLKDYQFLTNHHQEIGGKNKLKGANLVSLTPLDPDYTDMSILTDGVLSIPSNYHAGSLINSPDMKMSIAIPNSGNIKKLRVWLSYNPAYRVKLPHEVNLFSNGKLINRLYPEYPNDHSGHSMVEFDVPGSATGTFTLNLIKDPDTHAFAIEEIEAL